MTSTYVDPCILYLTHLLNSLKIRVGFGFDVHQLVEGRELWLGGIRLEHSKGLLGHSDADVLLHTVCLLYTSSFCCY